MIFCGNALEIQTFPSMTMNLISLSALWQPSWSRKRTCSQKLEVHAYTCAGIPQHTENILTLNVWGPSYFGLTRSISWLLMPWLLTSPGHEQPWYWLYRICRSFSYLRKGFEVPVSYQCGGMTYNVNICFMFPLKNLARKGLTRSGVHWFLISCYPFKFALYIIFKKNVKKM